LLGAFGLVRHRHVHAGQGGLVSSTRGQATQEKLVMRLKRRPFRAALPLIAALATAGTMASVAPAAAEGKIVQRPAIVGASVMRWLNPAPRADRSLSMRERKAMASRFDSRHGSGTYICTASGFGKRPSCFTR